MTTSYIAFLISVGVFFISTIVYLLSTSASTKKKILMLVNERRVLLNSLDFDKDIKFLSHLIMKAITFKIELVTNLAPTVNQKSEIISIKDSQLKEDTRKITEDIIGDLSEIQKERLLLYFDDMENLETYITREVYLPLATAYRKVNRSIFSFNTKSVSTPTK